LTQLTLDDLLGNGLLDLSDIAALRREIVGEVAQMYREIGDEAGRFRLHQEGAVNTDLLGDVFGPIVEMLNQLESGNTKVASALSDELSRIAGAGNEAKRAAEQAVLAFEGIENIDLADAQAQIIRVAEGIGGLDDLIASVLGAEGQQARVRAIGALANEMLTLARAGEMLREDGPAGFRAMLKQIGLSQEQIEQLQAALDGTLKLTEDTADAAGDIDYSGAANSASAMAGELERAGRALATLQGGLIDLDLQNVGLEAEIAALEAGASRAEARIEGELARARAQLEPLLSQRRPPIDGGGAPQATVAAEAALRDQERELERKLANEARIADLVKRFSSDGGGGGGVAGEVDLAGSVVEEFGQRFGGTFDFATAKIEGWRAATLASLQAAGLGHTELADMVDEIARDRLAEAYQQDLANREDWAAGIERGLDDIFGTQLTMAEVAEDTIKAAFRSMEDAFVSLATTGKIETADLVDFALRQLFRLAAAAATGNLDSAGGGIFGSILSSLFGGGIGVSTQASAAAAGLPSVFDSSGAIALPQFHEGGMVRDGRATRRVPAHLFDGARKRHSGGLAGNEVPAILEDDERVLTLAQQQSTAATIAGLAQLAAAPRPAAQPAPPPANVNVRVFGADREPRVEARQNGNDLDIDLIFREVEGRLGRNLAQGRGLAPAIAGRFNLRGGV
jgi:lambda family phage tail tape measure protein